MLSQPEFWIQIAAGALLLLYGRKLFWLCLAIVGFLLTFAVISRLDLELDDLWMLLVCLLLGAVGAVLAVMLQKIAVAVAGFAFGAYSTLFFLDSNNVDTGNYAWVLALVGGIIACVLAAAVFEIALVVLSSILGAGLIASATGLSATASVIAEPARDSRTPIGPSARSSSSDRRVWGRPRRRARSRSSSSTMSGRWSVSTCRSTWRSMRWHVSSARLLATWVTKKGDS